MFGRVKDAVADATKTLRRAFAGLEVRELSPEPFRPRHRGWKPLGAGSRPGLEILDASHQALTLLTEAVEDRAVEPLRARRHEETGWARWGAEAQVLRMEPLAAVQATRMAVPPLPRGARTLGSLEPPRRPPSHRWSEPLSRPGARSLDPALERPAARGGLEAMLALAVPFQGEDIQRLPKGLWMRYSLQLVRGTGENVRNLDVLGLFWIPRKGVADLRHDARLGRILVRLEPEALKARRVPFILARRKDDGILVSCYLEDP